jgi:hypothetical protein
MLVMLCILEEDGMMFSVSGAIPSPSFAVRQAMMPKEELDVNVFLNRLKIGCEC